MGSEVLRLLKGAEPYKNNWSKVEEIQLLLYAATGIALKEGFRKPDGSLDKERGLRCIEEIEKELARGGVETSGIAKTLGLEEGPTRKHPLLPGSSTLGGYGSAG